VEAAISDPARSRGVITKTHCDLRFSQAELAKAAGISESLLARIERRERRCTKSVAEEVWRAMWVIKRVKEYAIPSGVELLFRLETAFRVLAKA
jgi:predicted transcriptional regulator